jgi:hypothetical protein
VKPYPERRDSPAKQPFSYPLQRTVQWRHVFHSKGRPGSDADTEHAVEYYAQGILARPLKVEVVKKEIERILQRAM